MEMSAYDRVVKEELKRAGGGLQGAVRAKCITCAYDPAAQGSMRQQIHDCGVADCPLYPFRVEVAGQNAPPAVVQSELLESSKQWQRKRQLIRERQQKGTLRAAVEAMCIDCTFDAHEPGSWRQQVAACNMRSCPLWGQRAASSRRAHNCREVRPTAGECK